MIEELISLKEELSVSELLKAIITKTGYEAMLNEEGTKEAENRMDNIAELLGVAMEFENENVDNSLGDFLESIALVSDVDKIDDSTEAVTLMTMHSSKGLEYNIVFVAGMEEGLFPSKRALEENAEVEEERRLCYVAITRAKQKLFMLNAAKRTMYGFTSYCMPSRFLSEVPDNLVEYCGKSNTYLKNDDYSFSDSRGNSYIKQGKVITQTASEYNPNSKNYKGDNYESKFFTDTKPKYGVSVDSFLKNVTSSNNVNEKKDISKYSVGMNVKHKKFGVGKITKIEPEGEDLKLEIIFESFGLKRLMAGFTPLDIV